MLPSTGHYEYDAFISYSRRNRRSAWLVPRLQRALETYAIPKPIDSPILRGRKPRKALVFRDITSLELSSDLPQQLKEKLSTSRCLIVVCSPEAVESEWCRGEIAWFLNAHGDTARNRVFIILAEGEPDKVIPAEFQASKPNYADFRREPVDSWMGSWGHLFYDGTLHCLAGILQIKPDELKNRDLEHRRRKAVWLSVAASIFAAVVGLFAVYAVIQRNHARQQRDLALEAIDKLTFDVPDKLGKLPGSIPIITPLLEENLKLLTRLQEFNPDDDSPEARRAQAVNHNKIGERWLLIRNADNALSAYLDAEKLLIELDKQKRTGQSQRDLALINARIGSALLQKGDLVAARKRHEQAIAIDARLYADKPAETEFLRALAADNQLLGDDAVREVNNAGALSYFTQFYLAAERLATNPGTPGDRRLLATALDKQAMIYDLLNDRATALGYAQRCVTLTHELADDDLNDVPLRRELVTALQRLGNLQLKEKSQQAFETLAQMSDVAEQLARDPTNPDAKRNYAIALRLQADSLTAFGRFQECVYGYDKAEQVCNTALVDPDNHTARSQFVAILEGRAHAYEKSGNLKSALKDRERGIEELEKVPESVRERVVLNQLMTAHVQAAKLADNLGDFTLRDSHWKAAANLYQRQYGNTFQVGSWEPAQRGVLFDISGDIDAALAAYREDEAIQHEQAQRNPNPTTLRTWNLACAKLATALSSSGQSKEAAAVYDDMLSSATAYLKTHDNNTIRGDLAYAHLKQGELFQQAGKSVEALAAFQIAFETYRKVTEGHANSPETIYGYASIQRALVDAQLNQAINSKDPSSKRREQIKTGLQNAQELLGLDSALMKKVFPWIDGMTILTDVERIARLSALDKQSEQSAKAWRNAGDLALTLWGKNTSASARMLLTEHVALAADGLRNAGQLDQAVAIMENAAQVLQSSIIDIGDFVGEKQLSEVLGNLSWLHLLNGNRKAALENGERAIGLIHDQSISPTLINIAHAYLFNNQLEKAITIYGRYKDHTLINGRLWNEEVKDDFMLLRQTGRDCPEMKKVEEVLGISAI